MGFVEVRISSSRRFAEGKYGRYSEFAAELMRLNV
jgi:hypothetical protein